MRSKARWNKLFRTLSAFNISDNNIDEIISYKFLKNFLQKVILDLMCILKAYFFIKHDPDVISLIKLPS